jgi:purine-nucleoside phosphorylase
MRLEQLQETIEVPKAVRDFEPEWGIVLGSGLAGVVDEVDAILHLPYEEIRGLPRSSAPGHPGRFIFGRLAGQRVMVAQGRAHLYEGHSADDVTAAVRFMSSLGAQKLVLTNAAGSLNPAFEPGSWMILSDHLNLTGASPLLGAADFVDMTGAYSATLRERFHEVAAWTSILLHEGVYAGVLGPQYETPAEVRMLRTLGADAVGMSTVLEAIQARALGMEVVGLSCLTNWGAGMQQETKLDHDDVLETGRRASGQLAALLTRAVQQK